MPHLSPMSWILSILLIWFLTLSISTILWWNQFPLWPSTKTPDSSASPLNHQWHWKFMGGRQ